MKTQRFAIALTIINLALTGSFVKVTDKCGREQLLKP